MDNVSSPPGRSERRLEDLLLVLEVTRQLAALIDLQPLLEQIERSARKVLDCERASVFLHDPATGELFSRVATGVDVVRFPAGRGIAGEAFLRGTTVAVPDAYADPRFNPEIDRRTGFSTRSLLACPLVGLDYEPVGVLQALNKRGGAFDEWDIVLAKTLSAQAGVAVQRQWLIEDQARAERLQHDLEIARHIQRALLPRRAPSLAGYDIAGWNLPADETGGDYFDFQALPGGRLAITVADVSGHGVGPAIVAAECRAFFRAAVDSGAPPEQVVARVDALLTENLPDDRFVTVFFGVLDPETNRLAYVSAGHSPVYFARASGLELRRQEAQRLPLGVAPFLPVGPSVSLPFRPGDLLAVITDGFLEWAAPDHEQYGAERLARQLLGDCDRPAAEIIRRLHRAVVEYAAGQPQLDDLTAVVIRRL